jgi:hypothetical protein
MYTPPGSILENPSDYAPEQGKINYATEPGQHEGYGIGIQGYFFANDDSGKNYTIMGQKRSKRESAQLFGMSKVQSGVKAKNVNNHEEGRKIRPIRDK